MSRFLTSRPNFPQQPKWLRVGEQSTNTPTSLIALHKFDQRCFPKSKKLHIPPLYKSRRCEQRLTLFVGSIWTQTLIIGMK